MPVVDPPGIGAYNPDDAYGASLDEVKALLPHRRNWLDARPTEDDVLTFLTLMGGHVGAAVGDIPVLPADVAGRLSTLARRAVVLAVAAQTEAAGTPERANPNDASSYANWLQARADEALVLAVEFAAGLVSGDGPPGAELEVSEPAWSFPDPVGWAARGI